MAEIRVNATGGLKLFDADDSHYAQIIAGTITSNVNAITLGHDVVSIVDNLALTSDSSVLKFGADNDTTLTHTDGTGLTLNSTNKLCFNDASQFVQGSSATVLSIGATDEIDLTATAVDLNGTLNVSGVATFQATPVFPDGSLAIIDLDIDGGTDIGAAIVDADLFIIDDGAGGTNRKVAASRIKTYASGGKIVQYTNGTSTTAVTITSTSDTTTNCSGAITPTSSSNKIIVTASVAVQSYDNSGNCCRTRVKVYRDIGGAGFSNSIMVGGINSGHCRTEDDSQERTQYDWVNICFVDSPATTSAVTYTVYGSLSSASSMSVGYGSQLQTMLLMETDES